MTWVLIILAATNSSLGGVALEKIEFKTQDLCLKAIQQIQGMSPYKPVTGRCLKVK